MVRRLSIVLSLAALAIPALPARAQTAQPPWKTENLQYFPSDISRQQLTQRMREFSLALGVRCQYCHAGGDGVSFDGVRFASDEKPAKVKARLMLRMVDEINNGALARLPSRAEPRVTVECATCHRGSAVPKSLQTLLFEIVQTQGAPAAIARYRDLRKDLESGRYNFGEWEINELARRLAEAGNVRGALAMLEMNKEFNPDSRALDQLIPEAKKRVAEAEKKPQ